MTLKETCNDLYDIAVNGRFNGEHFTKTRFYKYVSNMFRPEVNDNELYMIIELPDGQWYCKIEQYAPHQYDYYIPETRKQEDGLIEKLMNKYKGGKNESKNNS